MEELIKIFQECLKHIDPVVMLMVICGGVFAKNYLSAINWPTTYKTLLMSFIFIDMLILGQWISGTLNREKIADYVTTYCVSTSFYELLLKYLFDFLFKKKPDEV